MGIRGLLPNLKSITTRTHISKYSGKIAGIDAYGWLHKGAYGCCMELAQGVDTDLYVDYCMDRIKLLQKYDVTPILVLDGAPLPAKAVTNAGRTDARSKNKQRGIELIQNGNEKEGRAILSRITSVTREMKDRLINALREANVAFIIAPYEADAQLAYMSKQKLIDVVISDDSDCIPYGCKRVLFKFELDGGVQEIKRRNLGACEELKMVSWTDEMLISMCILAGCDYCLPVQGIGLVTAFRLVSQHRDIIALLKAIRSRVPTLAENYEITFLKALLTFRHQLVYDPVQEELRHHRPLDVSEKLLALLDESSVDLSFLGKTVSKKVAKGIAEYRLDPVTYEALSAAAVVVVTNLPTNSSRPEQRTRDENSSPRYETPFVSSSFRPIIPKFDVEAEDEDIIEVSLLGQSTTNSSPKVSKGGKRSFHSKIRHEKKSGKAKKLKSPPIENPAAAQTPVAKALESTAAAPIEATEKTKKFKSAMDNKFSELIKQHSRQNPNATNVPNFAKKWEPVGVKPSRRLPLADLQSRVATNSPMPFTSCKRSEIILPKETNTTLSPFLSGITTTSMPSAEEKWDRILGGGINFEAYDDDNDDSNNPFSHHAFNSSRRNAETESSVDFGSTTTSNDDSSAFLNFKSQFSK